ncbi:MAG: class I SAM-dependent methyltransferase [Ignavibacteria bacterium]|jgi:demethylmenaquinone methyltransferase/2-methoxy-6-polyprenyl-1,4-benzoquinol methylase
MSQIKTYKILTRFRKPLIEKIIDSLDITPDSKGIDIGCGIGNITNFLVKKISLNGKLIGLDYSAEMINYAKKNLTSKNVEFLQGNINNIDFPSNSFDWIWSMDTIWAGPNEFGCPTEEPDKIINQLYQILKPGGKIYLLFWTSQKFLPGYPLLEARLNASTSANAPYIENMDSYIHVMNGIKWLRRAKFDNIKAISFIGDISGPLNENDKKALTTFFEMFWGNSENEISKDDWKKFKKICSPDSDCFILNQPDYYGYYTYTLFKGIKK